MSEYITVSEFAKRIGKSRQYVDRLTSTKLSTYCKLVDNKKMISTQGLKEFDCQPTVNQSINKTVNPVNQTVNKIDNQVDKPQSKEKAPDPPPAETNTEPSQAPEKDDLIKLLRDQLEAKDRQIEQLHESYQKQLEAKDRQIETKDQQISAFIKMQMDKEQTKLETKQAQPDIVINAPVHENKPDQKQTTQQEQPKNKPISAGTKHKTVMKSADQRHDPSGIGKIFAGFINKIVKR